MTDKKCRHVWKPLGTRGVWSRCVCGAIRFKTFPAFNARTGESKPYCDRK